MKIMSLSRTFIRYKQLIYLLEFVPTIPPALCTGCGPIRVDRVVNHLKRALLLYNFLVKSASRFNVKRENFLGACPQTP